MQAFENYRTRLGVGGATVRDRRISDAKHFVTAHAAESIACKDIEIDGAQRKVIMVSTALPTEKILRSMPDEDFTVGSIAVIRGSHWLITSRDHDDDVTVRARAELCNRQLTWQNKNTREIISRWCTASKPYYSNIDKSFKVDVSSREFKIQLPYDNETSLIELDDRFMLEVIAGRPKTYKVTSIDATTERYDRDGEISGFLVLNVTQDFHNPDTDNAVLGICDYVLPNTVISEKSTLSIEYSGDPIIKAGGSWKKFTMTRTNTTAGVDAMIPMWSIDVTPEHTNWIESSIDGATLRIRAKDDARINGTIVLICAADGVTGNKCTLEVEVICV